MTREPLFDPEARTFCYVFDDDRYLVGGPTSSAGTALNGLFALLPPDVAEEQRFERAVALAAEVPVGADALLTLPFLAGERAPYWMSHLRGAVIGLGTTHDRRHLLRSALESVVYALHSIADVLRERIGRPSRILLSGELARAPSMRAMMADGFGVEASQPSIGEASVFGAAMIAAAAVGAIGNLTTVRELLTYPQRDRPRSEEQERYEQVYRCYREAVEANIPLFGSLELLHSPHAFA